MSGPFELLVVALVVGAALAYVLLKSLRAAKTLAKGQAPRCCSDKEGYAERAGLSSCPDSDGATVGTGPAGDTPARGSGISGAQGSFVSPCAGCTGCSQGRG